jgi:hypothetical protein
MTRITIDDVDNLHDLSNATAVVMRAFANQEAYTEQEQRFSKGRTPGREPFAAIRSRCHTSLAQSRHPLGTVHRELHPGRGFPHVVHPPAGIVTVNVVLSITVCGNPDAAADESTRCIRTWAVEHLDGEGLFK